MNRGVWIGAFGSLVPPLALAAVCLFASNATRSGETAYGIGLFIATPILQGVGAGVFSQWQERQPWRVAAQANGIGLALLALGFLAFRLEGLLCLLMAAPLIAPLSFLGAWIGWRIRHGNSSAQLSLPTVTVLALAGAGGGLGPVPQESRAEVTTVWHLDAPPARVWPYVLSLPAVRPSRWWLFRLGVAHPLRTDTRSDGTRICLLSTGPMPEVVTARAERRHLAFRVLTTPASMHELNPFEKVNAPHLGTTYRGEEGEFFLTPERGGTRVVARSAYRLRMAPFGYWRFWSDSIVAHVHESVVDEIRRRTGDFD